MTENRMTGPVGGLGTTTGRSETICIDTHRVLDSCRDRDCFEDVRVYLGAYGQSLIDNHATMRAIDAKIVWVYIGIKEVPFNDGFYQLEVKYYVMLRFEACVGGKTQTFSGLAVIEKKVVLWGGEGNVTIFRSNENTTFCNGEGDITTNLPVGAVETVPPIVLGNKIIDCNCHMHYGCCNVGLNEIPDAVTSYLEEPLTDPDGGHRLFVSLGLFSVIRLERPAQYLISASDYSVPEKECVSADEGDPCSLFRAMQFPVDEFTPAGITHPDKATGGKCGCGKN